MATVCVEFGENTSDYSPKKYKVRDREGKETRNKNNAVSETAAW